MTETILLGGTSHTGKTTLAAKLAAVTGGAAISTDTLGRHPGRPWPEVRPHVAEFYQRLSAESIYQFLLIHHANLWPGIKTLLKQQQVESQAQVLILEGSALRPELVAELPPQRAVWLMASEDFLAQRMFSASAYQQAGPDARTVIDAFVTRSLRDNAEIVSQARRLGLKLLDVESPAVVTEFITQCQAAFTDSDFYSGRENP